MDNQESTLVELVNAPMSAGDREVWNSIAIAMGSDPGELSGPGLVRLVQAAQQVIGRMQAVQEVAIAALAVPGVAGDPDGLLALSERRRERGIEPDLEWQLDIDDAAHRLAATQIAAALRLGPVTGSCRVLDAIGLVRDYPTVLDALADGRIDRGRAMNICRHTSQLDCPARADLVDKALGQSAELTPRQLDQWLQTEVTAADPAGARARREEAVGRRRLVKTPLSEGMGQFGAILPIDRVTQAWDLFDLLGRGLKGLVEGDQRGIDACRADGFADVIELLAAGDTINLAALLARGAGCPDEDMPGDTQHPSADSDSSTNDENSREELGSDDQPADAGPVSQHGDPTPARPRPDHTGDQSAPSTSNLSADHRHSSPADKQPTEPPCEQPDLPRLPEARAALPTQQGRPVHLTITLSLDALARLRDDPAWLEGYGALDTEYARLIAQTATTITLLVHDQQGLPVGASELRYRPKQSVRDKVITLHPRCVFLGCTVPATNCDLDHHQPFDHQNPTLGGRTTVPGLFPLCRNHHNLHTHGGWNYHHNPDGTWTFTSPLGLKYHRTAGKVPTLADDPNQPPPF